MPECFDCRVVRPTGELRRTTRHGVKGFLCRDRFACNRRADKVRADERAAELKVEEVGRIERAFDQLERLKARLRGAWNGEALADVRVAHEALGRYINDETKED